MILDLDGATTEPSRRTHVVTISASVAAAALVLLYALLVPVPPTSAPPLAAPPAPSPASMMVWSASDPTWIRGGPFEESLRDAVSTMCAAVVGSSPSVHLVIDGSGRVVAAYTGGTTGRFIPLPRAYVGSGWLTVPCDTSDVFAPRLNRAR